MSEQILGDNQKPERRAAEIEERGQADPVALVGAQMREMADPKDGLAPTPVWLLLLFLALAGWSGYYLAAQSGGFKPDVYDENWSGAPQVQQKKAERQDPMVLGKQVFNNCMQCHQENGQGVPGAFPPLAGSEWVLGSPDTLARIVLHGVQGQLQVKGGTYNGEMPAWEQLKDEQLAAVLTYVRASFGNNASAVEPELIAAVRKQSASHTQHWTAAELKEAEKTPVTVPSSGAEPATKEPAK